MVRLLNLAGFFRSLFCELERYNIPFVPVTLERERKKEREWTDRRIDSNSVPAGNGDADDTICPTSITTRVYTRNF